MALPVSISSISIPLWMLIILGFLMAFGITWFTIPSIVNISRAKGLCNAPNGRTSHTGTIPSLGGIAVFVGIVISTVIFAGAYFIFELGDTGSLVTGLVLGVLTCRFLQLELNADGAAYIQSAPAVVFGILIVPLFDTLRVFILRVSQGKSPFFGDRQHIHNCLLKLGYTHLQVTLILIFVNLFFICLSYLLQGIGIVLLTCTIIGLASLMSYILLILVHKNAKNVIT